ncbi:19698_t:CDS:2 [Funneliformis geosporum]|nr:19698_t:CDS:2 [Funneliformis geosporum]
MLPSLQLLEKVSREVRSIPNRRKESKRRVHYSLFLLGYKSGLRVSEAVKFDLEKKNKQGLYRIQKPKGKSERLVYVPKEVIKDKSIELSPHTLRRSFATYHAENEPNSDVGSILAEPIIRDKPLILPKKPIQQDNPPLLTKISKKPITNYQPKSIISRISTPSISQKTEISEPLLVITDQQEQENQTKNVLLAKIRNLEEQLKQTQAENNNLKSLINSEKQNNQSLKETITNLTHQNHASEQNHTNLLNAYQKAFNDKVKAERQVNDYEKQLKTIAKSLYQ